MRPGFDSRTRRHMWVEFVFGSLPCSERFFSGYSGFPLSSKTNISKFQFDLELSSTLSWTSGSGDCASTPCVWHWIYIFFFANELNQKVLRIFHGPEYQPLRTNSRWYLKPGNAYFPVKILWRIKPSHLVASLTRFYKWNLLTSLKAFTVALHHHWTFFPSAEKEAHFVSIHKITENDIGNWDRKTG